MRPPPAPPALAPAAEKKPESGASGSGDLGPPPAPLSGPARVDDPPFVARSDNGSRMPALSLPPASLAASVPPLVTSSPPWRADVGEPKEVGAPAEPLDAVLGDDSEDGGPATEARAVLAGVPPPGARPLGKELARGRDVVAALAASWEVADSARRTTGATVLSNVAFTGATTLLSDPVTDLATAAIVGAEALAVRAIAAASD
jgi:hypothetical protein